MIGVILRITDKNVKSVKTCFELLTVNTEMMLKTLYFLGRECGLQGWNKNKVGRREIATTHNIYL